MAASISPNDEKAWPQEEIKPADWHHRCSDCMKSQQGPADLRWECTASVSFVEVHEPPNHHPREPCELKPRGRSTVGMFPDRVEEPGSENGLERPRDLWDRKCTHEAVQNANDHHRGSGLHRHPIRQLLAQWTQCTAPIGDSEIGRL
jgi:hypothetical protein